MRVGFHGARVRVRGFSLVRECRCGSPKNVRLICPPHPPCPLGAR